MNTPLSSPAPPASAASPAPPASAASPAPPASAASPAPPASAASPAPPTPSASPAPPAPAAPRLHFLDALRVLALGVLMAYHVGMLYVRWPFHVKSAAAGPELEPWMRLSGPWRMNLLFLVSGAATALMLAGTRPGLAWLRRRSGRLLKPLLLGMLVVVPPQAYFEWVQRFHGSGDGASFVALYYGLGARPCDARGCLLMPTWNHLWFLPYVWLYTVAGVGVLALWPQALERAGRAAPAVLRGWRLWIWPLAVLAATRLVLAPRYPENHAVWGDLFVHAQQVASFAFGAVLARSQGLWARLESVRWPALLAAVAGWSLALAAEHAAVRALAVSLQQGAALAAVLGFGYRHLNQPRHWVRTLGEGVFPMYLWHQTVTLAAFVALSRAGLPTVVEALAVLAITLLASWAGWRLLRHVAVLRPWIGLQALPTRGPGAARAPAAGPDARSEAPGLKA